MGSLIVIAALRTALLGFAAVAAIGAACAQETDLPSMGGAASAPPRPPAIAPLKPEWTSPTGYGLSFRWLGWTVKPPAPPLTAPAPAASATAPLAAPAAPLLEILPADKTPELCTVKERRGAAQPAGITQEQYSAATVPGKDNFVAAYTKNDPMGGSTIKSADYTMVGDVAVLRIALETKDPSKPIIARENAYFAVLSDTATTHVLAECYIGQATPKANLKDAGRILDTLFVQGKAFAPPPAPASQPAPARTP
jgi:hypothetical protein